MGNFGYIFGYILFASFVIGGLIGHLAGYYQRKHEEPLHIQILVDKWRKEHQHEH